MFYFHMNNILWTVIFVNSQDERLIDRTNRLRVATTDINNHIVYLSDKLHGDFLSRVFIHELGHVTMESFGLLKDIHSMVSKRYWIEIEEWICNFIADYGYGIYQITRSFLGNDAMKHIPKEIEKLVA